jgi:hypothetical protein
VVSSPLFVRKAGGSKPAVFKKTMRFPEIGRFTDFLQIDPHVKAWVNVWVNVRIVLNVTLHIGPSVVVHIISHTIVTIPDVLLKTK